MQALTTRWRSRPQNSPQAKVNPPLKLSPKRSFSSVLFSSAQFSPRSCPTLCDPMNCSTPDLPVHHHLPEFTQTNVHQVGDAIQPSHHLIPFSSCPQSLPASESFPVSQLCMRWPKYWSFSFSIIPSKEHPGLISFRMDWLDLLAVQGTLKSLLQHHNSNLVTPKIYLEEGSELDTLEIVAQCFNFTTLPIFL